MPFSYCQPPYDNEIAALIDKKLTFRQQNVMGKELIYKIVYYKNILLWKQNLKNWKKFFRN